MRSAEKNITFNVLMKFKVTSLKTCQVIKSTLPKTSKNESIREITRRIWLSLMERASVSAISLRDNRSKCHMDEKRIQCLSNASQHVSIYLQPFPSNSTRKFKSSPF